MDDDARKGGAHANRTTEFQKAILQQTSVTGQEKEWSMEISVLAYCLPGDTRKAIEYHEKCLNNAMEIGDRAGEEAIYANLGNTYFSLGDFRKAIEYHEKHLKIAMEIGDRAGEGAAYGDLGNAYRSLGKAQKAIEYHKKAFKIALGIGDRYLEGRACGNLGIDYRSLGYLRKAIEYLEKHLKLAMAFGDRAGEGAAYGNLGNAYLSRGDFRKAIEYHEKHLKVAMEIGDRAGEGAAYGNLGNAYLSRGDFRKAIEYQEKHLKRAMEIGDRAGEEAAYGNLGNAYLSRGDFQKAIEYHEKRLKIAMEIGDRAGEGAGYGNLGGAYRSRGDFRKAIAYHEKGLKIAMEIGDRAGEGASYGNLGNNYDSLGDFRKAIGYHEKDLKMAMEMGDRAGEGGTYGNLGVAYQSLGDFREAIKYHEIHSKIAMEIGDRAGEAKAYSNLSIAYNSLDDLPKAFEYHEKYFNIAMEIGDRDLEGRAYEHRGIAYRLLGNLEKAIEYHEKHCNIAIEIGDQDGEGRAYGNLGSDYRLLGDFRKAIEYHEKRLTIAAKIGNRAEEGGAHADIGTAYFSHGQFENAVVNFVSAVEVFNTMRSLLKSEDDLKMRFREQHEKTYTALWRSLLKIGKIDEALLAADRGRAQTLSDNLLIQYKIVSPSSAATNITDSEATIIGLLSKFSTPIIFLGIEGPKINIWFLNRGRKVLFLQGKLQGNITSEDPIRALLQSAMEEIEAGGEVVCENRTLDKLTTGFPSGRDVFKEVEKSFQSSENPFKPFYHAVMGPICSMLGPQDDDLVIVPDGALCFIPWATVIESIRIRTVPSLTSYHLILSVPEDYHKKTGALLVGNPYLEQLEKPLDDLPYAQKEVEMIATILRSRPLTGRQATKAEVMKRIPAVGLIHIAAHGNRHTGEIALSPNPGWTSQFPEEEDYILKMSDVQAANLRASLVVLSCCHSGRGKILKGEGMVGIARAFLAAGARSVLVSLWAIDDEATMVFMKSFYQYLKEGKTASAAVHESMKSLRESKFSAVRYWAPFQLIGDDVKIEFEARDHV